MLNRLATATAALAVLGASSVCAQPAPPERPEGTRPPAVSREDAGAYLEARIAALHSGLQLTPEQERQWAPFEQAVRELAKLRQQDTQAGAQAGASQRGGEPPPSGADDLIARIERRADALTRRGAALKALAQAAAPLWQSLDEGQMRRFAVLARPSNFRGGFGARDERGGFGRGFGPRGPGSGRDGDFGRRRFGFGGRGDDDGSGPRGFGPQGRGRDGDRQRYGFGGPRSFGRDGDDYRYGFGSRDFGPPEFGRRDFGGDGDRYRYGDGRRDFDRRDDRRDFERRDFGRREFDRRDLGRDGDGYRYGYGPAPRELGPRGFEPRDFGRDGGGYRYDYGPRDYGRGRNRPGDFRTLDEPEGELHGHPGPARRVLAMDRLWTDMIGLTRARP